MEFEKQGNSELATEKFNEALEIDIKYSNSVKLNKEIKLKN